METQQMKDFHPLVTCVVPIYNSEQYLEQGIESLLAQTYDNLEIILVDDKSSDSSWGICKKYALQHQNIHAFRNKKNSGGPLRGREKGIQQSNGDWITFMDGDDYVAPDYIANLIKATKCGRYDMAVTGYSRLQKNNKIEHFDWKDYSQTTNERLASFYAHFLSHDFWTDPTDTLGQNIIRASICKNTDLSQYSNNVYAEDTLMALAFLANSRSGINFTDTHDFIWRQLDGSGSNGGFSDRADKTEFYQACLDIFHREDIYKVVSANSPLISIVIPVYNVEKYLPECLDGVCRQSYRNLEIIVVNDGSTDGSENIIERYQQTEARISVIKQNNKGLNMARAAGAKVSSGSYISFVDSDDVIDENYIRFLYESLVWNDVDISLCGYTNFVKTTKKREASHISIAEPLQVLKSRRESLLYFLGEIESAPNVHQMTAWGKLYRTAIIKNTDWLISNYRRHEDNMETLQWYSGAIKGIAVSSGQLYYYRENPNSITQKLELNTNPIGKKINYFQYLHELYIQTKEFINDSNYDRAILNNFSNINRIQVQRLSDRGLMDSECMQSATNNWNVIINDFNKMIQNLENSMRNYENSIDAIHASLSWRVTKPLRVFKRILLNLK